MTVTVVSDIKICSHIDITLLDLEV